MGKTEKRETAETIGDQTKEWKQRTRRENRREEAGGETESDAVDERCYCCGVVETRKEDWERAEQCCRLLEWWLGCVE